MSENLMDTEAEGLGCWHTPQLQGDALYWPSTTCLGGDRTPVAQSVGSIDEPELRLLDPQSV